MERSDLTHRFAFHPATDAEKRDAHTSARQACHFAAQRIDELCTDCREKSLAITKLEEAMFWANAALARNGKTHYEPLPQTPDPGVRQS